MSLPYIQLESDFITTKAPRIAAVLKVHRHVIIGMASELFNHAVSDTGSKTKPPDGCVIDPEAPAIIEAWMGWTGEPGKALEAFWRVDSFEKLEIGIRIKGMERYRAAWEKNTRRKPDGNRPVTGKKPDETGPEMERKMERKTEMEKPLPSEVVGKPPASVPRIYEEPTKPEEDWGYEEFFQWAQTRRIASGLMGEDPIRFEKLRAWWGVVVVHGVGVERLKEAYYAYGEDQFWAKKKPKHPFHGFMSQWRDFVPQEAA